MNKSTIGGILVVVLIAAAGVVVYTQRDGASGTENATSTPEGKKMAFDVFLKQGGSAECTVHPVINGIEGTGVVYVDAGKVRGDFTFVTEAQTVLFSLIVRDGYSYQWSDQMSEGMRLELPEGSTGFEGEAVGDYECKDWQADQSKFEVPAEVEFADFSPPTTEAQ